MTASALLLDAFVDFIALLPDTLVDFFAMYRHIWRSGDTEPDLVAADTEDRDGNVVANVESFAISAAREDQQDGVPLLIGQTVRSGANLALLAAKSGLPHLSGVQVVRQRPFGTRLS